MSLSTDTGGSQVILRAPQPRIQTVFGGIIDDAATFSRVTLTSTQTGDGIQFDSVRFGAFGGPTASAQNLLQNGGFEEGPEGTFAFSTLPGGSTAIVGWTVTGSNIDYLGPGWDVFEGFNALDLDGAGSTDGGIQQTFPTVPGATYAVSFALSGNPEGSPPIKEVLVTVGDFIDTFLHVVPSGDSRSNQTWENQFFTFSALGDTSTIAFKSLSPPGASFGPLIDDVVVTSVNICPGGEVEGDQDGDCDVDRDDIAIVLAGRGEPASGPDDPRDLDGDGQITVLDARRLVLLCSNAGCATS